MKSPLNLLFYILDDIGDECSVDTTRDRKTIVGRFESEGLSFLTISLSVLGKGLERGLSQGFVTPDLFPGFGFQAKIPRLFGGFFELIFDRSTGLLLDNPSVESIRGLRQVTLMWSKILVPCTDERVASAFDSFIKCEQELIGLSDRIPPAMLAEFDRISNLLFRDVYAAVDNSIASYSLRPKHGPGATAEKVIANGKYLFKTWSQRLENVFPFWRYATSRPFDSCRMDLVEFFEPGMEPPVRVVSVPKTLKTPRIIAIEPTHMQYMQQGILRAFNEEIEKDFILSQFISTVSQLPNQQLARQGSSDGSLATLDLSEASDRVSNFLVERLFRLHPHLGDGVQATRSQQADVPGHGIISLAKFASMGSALCFPMEMHVFLTLSFMGIQNAQGIRFTRRSQFRDFLGKVRVYGDDIIVPTDTAASVASTLELFGFKVNASKSFWTGKFRESCGAEYYDGHDVSLTRVRRLFPGSRRDVDELVSAVDLRNQLYERGYWIAVKALDDGLSSIIPMPAVADTSSILGKVSFLGYEEQRFCPKLHRPMVKGVTVRYTDRPSQADGDAALMKFFLKEGTEPIFSKKHLQYAGRPISSNTKYGWGYSY